MDTNTFQLALIELLFNLIALFINFFVAMLFPSS